MDKANTEIKLLSVGYEKYLSHSYQSLGYDYMMLRKEYVDRMGAAVQEIVKNLEAEDYQVSSEVVWAHPLVTKSFAKKPMSLMRTWSFDTVALIPRSNTTV
jgi:hypothetical protein